MCVKTLVDPERRVHVRIQYLVKHYFLFCFSVLEDLKAKTKLESEEYNSRLQVCNLFLLFISYF